MGSVPQDTESWQLGDPQRRHRTYDHHLGVKNTNPQLVSSNRSLLFLLSTFFFSLNNFRCKIVDSRNVWVMQLDCIRYSVWWLTLIITIWGKLYTFLLFVTCISQVFMRLTSEVEKLTITYVSLTFAYTHQWRTSKNLCISHQINHHSSKTDSMLSTPGGPTPWPLPKLGSLFWEDENMWAAYVRGLPKGTCL